MSKVEQLYNWLARDTTAEADHVLGAALEHAEPDYVQRIARLLIGRKRESAWAALFAHYRRLPPPIQTQLAAGSVLARAGIAAALKYPEPQARLDALTALAHLPCAQLCYVIADALRDPHPGVAAAAAAALRYQADRVVDARTAETPGPEFLAALDGERRQVVLALTEAIRTYDLHRRHEVVEAALWFAQDLGPPLWDALADHRSTCWHVVDQNLPAWNGPRLAGFLLLALAQPAWRKTATSLLDAWEGRDELAALMHCTPMLRNDAIRRAVGQLSRPRWFSANLQHLAQLPVDARANVPYWVCVLGFSEAERLHCLRHWQASSLPEVHRAAVYALAALDTPQAITVLEQVARRACPMQRFAGWYVHGRRLSDGARQPAIAEPQPVAAASVGGTRFHAEGT